MTVEPKEFVPDIVKAIKANDIQALTQLFQTYPDKINFETPLGNWLHVAATASEPATLEFLRDAGVDLHYRAPQSGGNLVDIAAQKDRLDVVKFAHGNGVELDVSKSTTNPLIAAAVARSVGVAQYLLDAGIDATASYPTGTGPNYDAVCFALEQGARDVARVIVLHVAGGDATRAQAHLDRAWAAVKANNPDAKAAPADPVL